MQKLSRSRQRRRSYSSVVHLWPACISCNSFSCRYDSSKFPWTYYGPNPSNNQSFLACSSCHLNWHFFCSKIELYSLPSFWSLGCTPKSFSIWRFPSPSSFNSISLHISSNRSCLLKNIMTVHSSTPSRLRTFWEYYQRFPRFFLRLLWIWQHFYPAQSDLWHPYQVLGMQLEKKHKVKSNDHSWSETVSWIAGFSPGSKTFLSDVRKKLPIHFFGLPYHVSRHEAA